MALDIAEDFTYRLPDGTIVDPDHLMSLPPEKVQALLDTKATTWDVMVFRKSMHGLRNDMQNFYRKQEDVNRKIFEAVDKISESLIVELKNGGDPKKWPLNKVVKDIYERERPIRNKAETKRVLKKYNTFLGIMLITLIMLLYFFHGPLNDFFLIIKKLIEPYGVAIVTIIILPLVYIGFKKFFYKSE
jgi:hypothetical protein